MATQDFSTVLVKDARIKDITPEIVYGVESGASSNTYQKFSAVSVSKSNLVFNVQVPSESVIVSRELLIRSTIDFKVTISNVPNGDLAFSYGNSDALQAFPLNSLFTTLSAQINNTNVSVNLQDVLPSLLRMNDSRHLYRYNGMTPSLPDQAYLLYSDAVLTNNNPLAGYSNASYDVDQLPRGSHPVILRKASYFASGSPTATGSIVRDANGTITTTGTFTPTGTADPTDKWVYELAVEVTEPLFLSPFIFGDSPYNKQGFVGLNALNLVCNVDTTCKRFFSTSNSGYTYEVELGNDTNNKGFSDDSAILMNFLSSQPTDLISAKNVVPYHDFSRFLTTTSEVINAGKNFNITSQNLQLNQIPDLFLITVRKPMNSQTVKDSTAFFSIENVSINFNNVSGLLSSATQQDLWRISINNGSTQNWKEFSGKAYRPDLSVGVGQNVPTTGSLLVLNPARDLSLPSYLSCGSIGQFNVQLNLTVRNNYISENIKPEICIVCVNSGLFTTVAGTSSIYTGILSKQMVLDAQAEPAEHTISSAEYYRQTGGMMLPKSALKEVVKTTLGMMDKSGSGVKSAGAMSAGRVLDGMAM